MKDAKPIPGYEGYYSVTRKGVVYSVRYGYKSPIKLSQNKNNHGYYMVALSVKGLRRYAAVHRLVAETYLRKPDGCDIVNHKNGQRDDNRVQNLEWCTQEENAKHGAYRRKLHDVGIKRAVSVRELAAL